MASEPKQNTSIWLALRNPAFVGLWIPSVVSGICAAAHDTAATWLMNALGASPLLLSLIATAASLPFFLFTLPAGALADLGNRRNLLIAVYLWLAAAAGLLAVCTWLHSVHPYVILTTVFLLGIGFAFNAPIWASVVAEIVQKEELASAITLGGVQMNLAGIVGPALGGLLLPIMGPAMLFSLNTLAFVATAWVISQRYHRRRRPEPHLENFLESFASAARYVRYTPGIQVILARNFLFGLFIAVVPALVPVVALQHLRLQASELGHRVEENLEHPGTFRTEMQISSWAEHLRQNARMTKTETELVERVWAMHSGEQERVVRHYLPANRMSTPLGFGQFRKHLEAGVNMPRRANVDAERDQKKSKAAEVEP